MAFEHEVRSLERDLLEFRLLVLEVVALFNVYADEMDKVNRDVQISKTAGSSAAVVGGILSAVGFGLSFVTFGASLGLTIAGGVIAAAGGITAGGASIGDAVEARKRNRQAQDLLEKINNKREQLLKRCFRMSRKLKTFCNIKELSGWTSFWTSMVCGTVTVGWNTAWKIIKTSVESGLKLADLSIDVGSGTVTVVRTLGGVARGFHIAGGVIGAIFLPIDIGLLAYHATNVANQSQHEVSTSLRRKAKKLEDACPSEQAINDMISEVTRACPNIN